MLAMACRAIARGNWRIIAALALLGAAAWMPDVNLPRNTSNTMVTFDITQSLNVADVMHDGVAVTRLALARAAMRETLLGLPCFSKVGWSIFADYRSFALLLPIEVCGNYDVLLSTLDQIDGRMRWANASNVNNGPICAFETGNKVGFQWRSDHLSPVGLHDTLADRGSRIVDMNWAGSAVRVPFSPNPEIPSAPATHCRGARPGPSPPAACSAPAEGRPRPGGADCRPIAAPVRCPCPPTPG